MEQVCAENIKWHPLMSSYRHERGSIRGIPKRPAGTDIAGNRNLIAAVEVADAKHCRDDCIDTTAQE